MSRRQQHQLRQMRQSASITFTVYQQALSNAISMYRYEATKHTAIKWPEWYRRTHVDNESYYHCFHSCARKRRSIS